MLNPRPDREGDGTDRRRVGVSGLSVRAKGSLQGNRIVSVPCGRTVAVSGDRTVPVA